MICFNFYLYLQLTSLLSNNLHTYMYIQILHVDFVLSVGVTLAVHSFASLPKEVIHFHSVITYLTTITRTLNLLY